jgi:hypothetical protein
MSKHESNFEWLQAWYNQWCDGDWEHTYGITIATIDNPGWSIDIDLTGTELQNKELGRVLIERSDSDWLWFTVENQTFQGRGGIFNLDELIGRFRAWTAASQ